MGKITKITEKQPKEVTLPDGNYFGIQSGYLIEMKYNGKIYDLTAEEGIRGSGNHVVVMIKDGVATFEDLKN